MHVAFSNMVGFLTLSYLQDQVKYPNCFNPQFYCVTDLLLMLGVETAVNKDSFGSNKHCYGLISIFDNVMSILVC